MRMLGRTAWAVLSVPRGCRFRLLPGAAKPNPGSSPCGDVARHLHPPAMERVDRPQAVWGGVTLKGELWHSAATGGGTRSGGRQRRHFVDAASWTSVRGRLFVNASSVSWPGLARPSTSCLALAATSRKSWASLRGRLFHVMAGPGPAIHGLPCARSNVPQVVDARPEGGHDGCESRTDDTPPVTCGDTLSCPGGDWRCPSGMTAAAFPASWPGLSRPSTSFLCVRTSVPQVMDARPKGGHDGERAGRTVREPE